MSETPDDGLLDQTQGRRHTARTVGIVVLASACVAAVALAVITATSAGRELDRPDQDLGGPGPQVAEAPADGWRWESYGTVELQVPQTWGYDGSPATPCLATPGAKPFVSRPGPIPSILCSNEVPTLDSRAAYVAFDNGPAGLRSFDHGWVRESRTIAGTSVTVLADDQALRERIFASARAITGTDVNGCAPSHPAAAARTWRPADAGGLGTIGAVKSVAICGYALWPADGRPLFTGRTFTGSDATALVDAVRSAPAGSGPDEPPTMCAPTELGDRIYVLSVHGTEHDQQVLVRYSGCTGNGTDDGVTRRRLTAEVLRPILSGADRMGEIMSGDVARLIYPTMPVK